MTRKSLSRASRLALIGVGVAAGLSLTPAVAKDKYVYSSANPDVVVAQSSDEIVIVAPYTVRRDARRSSAGRLDETVSVTRIVSIRDLDLRYPAGVDEMNRRIAYTAELVCDEAEAHMSASSATTDRECERRAIRDARRQARMLVERARYYG